MDKKAILKKILEDLESELSTLVEAAFEAKEAATSEESKAENKYDTRGLEASYLAGAQAKRAKELRAIIDGFERIQAKSYDSTTPIDITALVEVDVDGEELKTFFVVPHHGGMMIEIEGVSVFTISPDSPMGKNLQGARQGDSFSFQVKGEDKDYEIKKVQ